MRQKNGYLSAIAGDSETNRALQLAIICAAIALDLATGFNVEDPAKGLTFKAPADPVPASGTTPLRQTLSEFSETLPAN